MSVLTPTGQTQKDNGACPTCNKVATALPRIRDHDLLSKMRSNVFSSGAIRQLLDGAELELQECDREIAKLKSRIFAFELTKKKLNSHIVIMKSLLSPIRRLPNEILAEIFRFTEPRSIVKYTAQTSTISALNLATVCSQWRTVAFSTHCLWSTVILWLSRADEEQAWAIKMLLSHSGTIPLTIAILATDLREGHTTLDSLIQVSSRWHDLTLWAPFGQIGIALSVLRGKLPILKRLHISSECLASQRQILTVFERAPALEEVLLYHDEPDDVVLPWTQLKELTMHSRSSQGVMTVLRRCPEMTVLHIKTLKSSSAGDSVVKSRLTSLQLNMTIDIAIIEHLFLHLQLPVLSSLQLYDHYGCRTWPVSAFSSMLKNSSCTLTTLIIKDHSMSFSTFVSVLELLPRLKRLVMTHNINHVSGNTEETGVVHMFNDLLTSRLTIDEISHSSESTSRLLPSLTDLDIVSPVDELSDQGLLDMVLSRWHPFEDAANGAVSLKTISLLLNNHVFSDSMIESFQHLAVSGLTVSLRDKRGYCISKES